MNWIGSARYGPGYETLADLRGSRSSRPSFRSFVQMRYYINDLEFGVSFSEDTPLMKRRVYGLPIERAGLDAARYARPVAPELTSGGSYCPFCLDIWQLGHEILLNIDVSRAPLSHQEANSQYLNYRRPPPSLMFPLL